MKKIIFLMCTMAMLISCKNDKKSSDDSSTSYDQNNGLITVKGDFIYFADAAVLQTKNEIYGVVIDEKMQELNAAVQVYKIEDTDMVPVTVRVRRFEKPENEEGWPMRVEIKDILKVEKPDPKQEDIIKLGN